MATYDRFEDLPVWKDSIELAEKIYALAETSPFRRKYSLRDQIERAALSVSNNIAEGFERGTNQELLTFLYIARGSASEVRSMLLFLERLPVFKNLQFQISNLKSSVESISRQLRAWADSLQNSDIRGQRYLNERSKTLDKRKKEQQEFLKSLKRYTK